MLWLLVGRGLALELRHQLDHPLWHAACDTVFALSSAARRPGIAEVVLLIALAWPTYHVRRAMLTGFGDHPWRLVFPVVALAVLVAMLVYHRRGLWLEGFLASGGFILGLLATMAAGLYPDVLPARQGRPYSLTVDNAVSGHHALVTGLVWWPLGMLLAAGYFVYAYRMFFRSPETRPHGGT